MRLDRMDIVALARRMRDFFRGRPDYFHGHDELDMDTSMFVRCAAPGCAWKLTLGYPCPEHPNWIAGGVGPEEVTDG